MMKLRNPDSTRTAAGHMAAILASVVVGLIAGGAVAIAILSASPASVAPVVPGQVAVVISPSPIASPVANPSPAPTKKPTVPVKVAPPVSQATPTAAPVVKPPAPKPTPKPTPVAVKHSVVWNDPTQGIDPAVGGEIDGPTSVGSGTTVAILRGTFSCSVAPLYSFEIGIRDLTTGEQHWSNTTGASGNAQIVFADSMDVPGHTYLSMVRFLGTDVLCDWDLTLTT